MDSISEDFEIFKGLSETDSEVLEEKIDTSLEDLEIDTSLEDLEGFKRFS